MSTILEEHPGKPGKLEEHLGEAGILEEHPNKFGIHIDEETDEGETFYNIEIEYVSSDISFTFSPEDCDIISNVDIAAPTGGIEGAISNGDFRLTWDEHRIDLCCARYGSGGGGGLCVTLRNTQEIMASLRGVLAIWKSKVLQKGHPNKFDILFLLHSLEKRL